ncbi:hypothetical protein MKX01_018978 [Papaver californicum]|nr:hypothetical protein MKX01_018978 [Papaver californicum]
MSQHGTEISAGSVRISQLFFVGTRKLSGDQTVHFVESPALAPPEVAIDLEYQREHERELEKACYSALPDDYESDDGLFD